MNRILIISFILTLKSSLCFAIGQNRDFNSFVSDDGTYKLSHIAGASGYEYLQVWLNETKITEISPKDSGYSIDLGKTRIFKMKGQTLPIICVVWSSGVRIQQLMIYALKEKKAILKKTYISEQEINYEILNNKIQVSYIEQDIGKPAQAKEKTWPNAN